MSSLSTEVKIDSPWNLNKNVIGGDVKIEFDSFSLTIEDFVKMGIYETVIEHSKQIFETLDKDYNEEFQSFLINNGITRILYYLDDYSILEPDDSPCPIGDGLYYYENAWMYTETGITIVTGAPFNMYEQGVIDKY